MNWTRDKSLLLSLFCTGLFAAALLVLDVGVWWFARRFFVEYRGDPQQYAISQGTALASHCLVYTVGMLGNMSSSEIAYVRNTLNTGYETRYFEVTFSDLEE